MPKNKTLPHAILINKAELPITSKEWQSLENIVHNAEYEAPKKGDTNEHLSLKVMRAKKPGDPINYNEPLLKLLLKPELCCYLQQRLEMKSYFVDRVQIHHYQEGDFISMHCDNDSCPDYKFSLVLHMTEEYEGGEFRVQDKNKNIKSFRAPKHTLLITSSALSHEVTRVMSGERKVIVWFISEKDLTQKKSSEFRIAS
ncbi:MAG: 2OG-Fe(II) oxygenase [Candidatus Paracaedimonas acanthamoebae]|uniref:2OG-Fe(II) oxygenase n=1 Tax=Candidatus Paracaedimonas acanthamoebae TaxID=244581 RepID=A0A8J7Q0M6_9PROT|nr:2OG-Fe(II) oxygenase [Candidatus Paracaedimonas acanthamoebae]